MSPQSKTAEIIQSRDQTLTAVVEANRDRLLAIIGKKVRNQIEAEDVLQDVFEEYVEAYDLGVAIETLGAWLVRVAQNKIIDRFRRRKTKDENRDAVKLAETDERFKGPDEELIRSQLRAEMADAVDLLPDDQRSVFISHELEGKSFEEIAAETGVSINTLLSRKRYAVQFLRQHLKEIYDELE